MLPIVSSGSVVWESARVPLFPLPDIVLFPAMRLPLHVFEPRYRQMVSDVLAGDRLIAVPRLKPGFAEDYYESPAIFEVCGIGRITRHRLLHDGRFDIVVEGIARAELEEEASTTPYRVACARRLDDKVAADPLTVTAVKHEVWHLLGQLLPYLSEPDDRLESLAADARGVGEAADAQERLPQDQQAPLLADDGERAGDGAAGPVPGGFAHSRQSTPEFT